METPTIIKNIKQNPQAFMAGVAILGIPFAYMTGKRLGGGFVSIQKPMRVAIVALIGGISFVYLNKKNEK